MHVSGALSAIQATAPLKILAVMEATRVTGVARNVLDYARLARMGAGGLQVAFTFAIIRRGREQACARDGLVTAAAAANFPMQVLFERHRYDALLIDALRGVVEDYDPDIVETHHVKSHCLVALSRLWRHYKWVAFHHGYTQTDVKVRAYNQMDRWSLPRAAHVITTNRRFARMLERRGIRQERVSVLHNAVRDVQASDAEVAALRQALGLRSGESIVLSVGRLSHEKGQEHLLRAAALWRNRARLVIAGDGPDRPRLEWFARQLGCADSVVFAGLTPNVAPYYAMANVFVLPSLSEGSPNVLLEAMAAGLPIVATDVGGVPEIAADGIHALLVPPEDPEAIASAVDTLLRDRGLCERLGTAAQLTVRRQFTPEQRANALTRVYATVAGAYDRGSATTAPAFVP